MAQQRQIEQAAADVVHGRVGRRRHENPQMLLGQFADDLLQNGRLARSGRPLHENNRVPHVQTGPYGAGLLAVKHRKIRRGFLRGIEIRQRHDAQHAAQGQLAGHRAVLRRVAHHVHNTCHIALRALARLAAKFAVDLILVFTPSNRPDERRFVQNINREITDCRFRHARRIQLQTAAFAQRNGQIRRQRKLHDLHAVMAWDDDLRAFKGQLERLFAMQLAVLRLAQKIQIALHLPVAADRKDAFQRPLRIDGRRNAARRIIVKGECQLRIPFVFSHFRQDFRHQLFIQACPPN